MSKIIDNLDTTDTHEWLDMGNGRSKLVRLKRDENNKPIAFRELTKDQMNESLEHHGFSDGRKTDSKSEFRKWTKECGGEEMGNDRNRRVMKTTSSKDLTQDVVRSIDMLRNGYKPSIFNSREWE